MHTWVSQFTSKHSHCSFARELADRALLDFCRMRLNTKHELPRTERSLNSGRVTLLNTKEVAVFDQGMHPLPHFIVGVCAQKNYTVRCRHIEIKGTEVIRTVESSNLECVVPVWFLLGDNGS